MMGQRTHVRRGVAQLGSASALGAEGRRFKSCHPDRQRRQCRGFAYEWGRGLGVLSHRFDGHHPSPRSPPGRGRAGGPLGHSPRILGYRHRCGPAPRHRPLHRRGRLRGPRHPRRDHRRGSPCRRRAQLAPGCRRARPLSLPHPLAVPNRQARHGLVPGPAGSTHV